MSFKLGIKVQPGARKNAILGWGKDSEGKPLLKICVTTPPQKGKANDAVLALLAEHFHVAKSKLGVISGRNSRQKIVEIRDESIAATWKASS